MQPDQPADLLQLHLAIRTHESVVTNLLKATWQNVLYQTPHKFMSRDLWGDRLLRAAGSDLIAHTVFIDRLAR